MERHQKHFAGLAFGAPNEMLLHGFKQPVKVFIEKGQIRKFEGGAEAETLTRFYQFIAKFLGEAAYEVRGFHGGVHIGRVRLGDARDLECHAHLMHGEKYAKLAYLSPISGNSGIQKHMACRDASRER